MPRHHVNRLRAFHLFHPEDHLAQHVRHLHLHWEWLAAYLYVLGGLFLIIGSVLFLPQYVDYMADGSYMFVVASILYLIVSLHDLAEIFRATTFLKPVHTTAQDIMEVTAGVSYTLGASAFIVGSVLFLPTIEIEYPAAICFIGGSCLFVVGACVNVVQTYDSPDRKSLQYANLEAMVFVAGSCIYVCASVPYVFDFEADSDATEIFEMVAILYIWGSVCFFFGGLLNIKRLLSVHDYHSKLELELQPLTATTKGEEADEEDAVEEEMEEVEERKEAPVTPNTLGNSIMKGKLMKLPSAEDLVFGSTHSKNDSQDFSIVEENKA